MGCTERVAKYIESNVSHRPIYIKIYINFEGIQKASVVSINGMSSLS